MSKDNEPGPSTSGPSTSASASASSKIDSEVGVEPGNASGRVIKAHLAPRSKPLTMFSSTREMLIGVAGSMEGHGILYTELGDMNRTIDLESVRISRRNGEAAGVFSDHDDYREAEAAEARARLQANLEAEKRRKAEWEERETREAKAKEREAKERAKVEATGQHTQAQAQASK